MRCSRQHVAPDCSCITNRCRDGDPLGNSHLCASPILLQQPEHTLKLRSLISGTRRPHIVMANISAFDCLQTCLGLVAGSARLTVYERRLQIIQVQSNQPPSRLTCTGACRMSFKSPLSSTTSTDVHYRHDRS